MSIQISTDEYIRLLKVEAGMELLNVYLYTDYPKEETIKKMLNHIMLGLPFSTPDTPETERGWYE
jgi:hypothetical protein